MSQMPAIHRTVLYVEDEECDAIFMQRAFDKAGLGSALQVVGTGQAGIDYLSGAGPYADRAHYPLPAVVLLDLNLPVLSGFEVLQWLKGQPQLQNLPVVIFSSSSRDEDRQKSSELGAQAFLEKPISGLQFVSILQELRQKWL